MLITTIMGLLFFMAPMQAPAAKTPPIEPKIINHLVSWGHMTVEYRRSIEAIIIHSSYNALTPDSFSVAGILREYRKYDVSPHYIIDRKGDIYRLVPECDIAYQAGESRLPDGKTDVNAVSIGIELVNTPHDSSTEAQYRSLASLVKWIKSRYRIKYVLGHKDIAPLRKTDPWNFDWKKFREMVRQAP